MTSVTAPGRRLLTQLSAWLNSRAAPADRREMAGSLAVIGSVGGTLMLVALRLPGGDARAAALLVPLAGYGLAAMLAVAGERAPLWMFDAVVLAGAALATVAVAAAGSMSASLAMFYIWLAMYAFCYLPPLRSMLVIAVIAAGCAVVSPAGAHSAYWLLTVGTSTAVGMWVQRLVQRARDQGRRDALTGLCNRRWWSEESPRMLAQASRHHFPVSLVLLDLDHFKLYNDEFGHQAGDRLLAASGKAWLSLVRKGDALVRYGGEEFVALLPNCALDEAEMLADRLRRAVPGETTCSAGVAEWDGSETGDDLLARADAALYAAKQGGRDRTCVAPQHVEASAPAAGDPRARWRVMLRSVLVSHAVDAVYQPVVDLSTRRVVAYEALARPVGADARLSVTDLFDIAERVGHGRELDWLCRRAALEGARELPANLPLVVNTSCASLLDPLHEVDKFLLLLRWCRRDPATLVLEIGERAGIADLDGLREVVAAHRAHGIRFALDDVGSGGATLELLAAVTPEFIKLGASLVTTSERAGERAAVLAMLGFARSSRARTVAEGVEDEATALRMIALGVELGQGYRLRRPARLPKLATAV